MKAQLKFAIVFLVICHFLASSALAQINAPVMTLNASGLNVSVSWTKVQGAEGYNLYYAPYPYTGPETIGSIDLGDRQTFSIDLWDGAAFYVAVDAYSGNQFSGYSNIDYFVLDTSSGSFFPLRATDSQGAQITPSWTYRIAEGSNFTHYQDGIRLNLNFSDIDLSIDPSTMQRTATFGADISGSATGTTTIQSTQEIASLDGSTHISSENINMSMSLSAYGSSAYLNVNADANYADSYEWFLDRNDLDQLPVDFVYEPESIFATIDVDASITVDGYTELIPISDSISSSESWRIAAHLEEMKVQGTVYNNIVVVERTTYLPQIGYEGYTAQSQTLTYWVAKDIGMIKGSGQFDFLGNPLTVELVDTNLQQ